MKCARARAGQAIFSRGDHARSLYMLVSGNIRIEETDCVLKAGDLFGEAGLFSDAGRRTQTARALTNVELLMLTQTEFSQVCYQNPGLALYFLRLWTTRPIVDEAHHSSPREYAHASSFTTVRATTRNTRVSSEGKQGKLGELESDRGVLYCGSPQIFSTRFTHP